MEKNVDCGGGIHEKICSWLQQYPNLFLLAHNGRRFDFPILMTALYKTSKTDSFLQCVPGFIDSLPVFIKKKVSKSVIETGGPGTLSSRDKI